MRRIVHPRHARLPTHHGVYALPPPPGYTSGPPVVCRTAAGGPCRSPLTALERGVTELFVSEEVNYSVTVRSPVFMSVTRFTVGRC